MSSNSTLFQTEFIDNESSSTLFLLHGTGGTNNDFLFLDEPLDHRYNLLGIQGNVVEQGMNRFFKRTSLHVFDQNSINEESEKLSRFIPEWKKKHPTSTNEIFLGYSNGANMLLATMFRYPKLLKKMILLHPMMPFEVDDTSDLSDHSIFVSLGLTDTMVPYTKGISVINHLQTMGAVLTVKEYSTGHEITQQELKDIIHFLLSPSIIL